MGTATIKVKLAQSLAWHDQCPLYQIYVDLKKAYDALDREQTLIIFGGLWSRTKDAAPPEAFLGHCKIGVPHWG